MRACQPFLVSVFRAYPHLPKAISSLTSKATLTSTKAASNSCSDTHSKPMAWRLIPPTGRFRARTKRRRSNDLSISSSSESSGIPSCTSTTNGELLSAIGTSCQVAGGTAWLWARADAFESVDTLFIDEAAQMSVANVLAVSQEASSVVLLGDPRQLEQPMQGSHPDGCDASALTHMLGIHVTIPPDRGLFLEETWRLHPDICSFTFELFYEGRLRSRPGLELQAIKVGEQDSRLGVALPSSFAFWQPKLLSGGSRGSTYACRKNLRLGRDLD